MLRKTSFLIEEINTRCPFLHEIELWEEERDFMQLFINDVITKMGFVPKMLTYPPLDFVIACEFMHKKFNANIYMNAFKYKATEFRCGVTNYLGNFVMVEHPYIVDIAVRTLEEMKRIAKIPFIEGGQLADGNKEEETPGIKPTIH